MEMRNRRKMMMIFMLVIAVLVSACSSNTNNNKGEVAPKTNNQNTKETDKESPKADAESLGKYNPPIEVHAARQYDQAAKFLPGEDLEHNIWSKTYLNELGIKLTYDWTVLGDADKYNQKLNIAIASNHLPDTFKVNATQLKQLIENDQLADLTKAFDQYGSPLTKEIMMADGGNAIKSATFNKKLFALPRTGSAIDGAPLLWVRTDWLKKLNLPDPKTMQDVFTIAEAFTKQDPDGNGKPDTFGMGLGKALYGGLAGLEGFFNGYHSYPNTWIKDGNGKITYGSIQPETKQALIKLSEMYKAGQLDREFGVKESAQVTEAVTSGKLGMIYGPMWIPLSIKGGKELNPNMEWQAFALPSIDGTPSKSQIGFPVNEYFVVRKGYNNPEAAVKMLNISNEKLLGKTSDIETYSVNKDGIALWTYAFFYQERPTKNLDAHLHLKPALEAKSNNGLSAEEKFYYSEIMKFRDGDNKSWGFERVFGPTTTGFAAIDQLNRENRFMSTQFYGAPTPGMVENLSSLTKLELETFTKIIMGEASIDTFDKFVENWNKIGGSQILTEINKWLANQ